MIHQGRSLESRQFGKFVHPAWRHRHGAADPVMRFLEQQRQPQGHVNMTGDLEQPAVLAGEIDRRHISPALRDQLGGESAPGRVPRAEV